MHATPVVDAVPAAATDPWAEMLNEARDHAAGAGALAGAGEPFCTRLLGQQWRRGVAAIVARLPNPQHRQDLAEALAADADAADAASGMEDLGAAACLQQQLRSLGAAGSPTFAVGLLALGVSPPAVLAEGRSLPDTATTLLSIAAVLARAATLRAELTAGMRAGAVLRRAFLMTSQRRGRVA